MEYGILKRWIWLAYISKQGVEKKREQMGRGLGGVNHPQSDQYEYLCRTELLVK